MTDIRNDNPSGFSLDLGDTFGGTDGGFGTSPSLGHDGYEPSASGGFGSLFDSNTKPPATFDLGFEFDADFGTDFGANAEDLWNTGSDFSYGDPFGADWSLDRSPYDFGSSNLHEEPREFDLGWDFGWDIGTTEDQELGLGLDDFEWNWDAPGFDTEPAEFSLWGGLPRQDDAWFETNFDFGFGFDFDFRNDLEAGGDFNLDDAAWFHGLGEAGVESSWTPVFRGPVLEPNPSAPGFQLTIEQGDSLSALAQSLGVTVDDLLAVNPDITRESVLQIGQTLAVPAWTHSETVAVRGHAKAYAAAERIHAALESSGTEMAKVVEIRRAIASAGPGEGPALIEAMHKMALDEELMTSLDPRYRELVQEQIHNLGGSTIEYLEPVLEQIGYGYVEGIAEGGVEAVEAFKALFRAQTWKDLGALGTTVVKATNLGVGLVDPEAQSEAMAELILMTQASWETFRDGWKEAKANGTTARYISEAAGRLTTEAFIGGATGAATTAARTGLRLGLNAGEAAALGRLVDGIELASSWRADWMPDEVLGMLSNEGLAALRAVHKAHELDNNKGLLPGVIEQKKVNRNIALSEVLVEELSPQDMARFADLLEASYPDFHRGAYPGMDPSRLPSLEKPLFHDAHVLFPDVTYKPGRRGGVRASIAGYHHRPGGVDAPGVRLVDSQLPDANGVYKGFVEFHDPLTGTWGPRKAKTFFPDGWSASRIGREVTGAFQSRKPGTGRLWEGYSPSGVLIKGWLDSAGNIATAYPAPFE